MIIHNCAQHGEEWERLRIGIPTSSEFSKIVTTSGEPSKQRTDYAYRLITERIKQRKLKSYQSRAMERGQLVEEEAVDWYEFDQEVSTRKVGFVTNDHYQYRETDAVIETGLIGCSPDRLVGEVGLLEIKSPDPESGEQVRYLATGRAHLHHKQQLQGQLMITGRNWVDILCWDPELPKCFVRVHRDEHFMLMLSTELRKFNKFLETEMEKIVTGGFVHVPEAKATLRQQLLDTLATDQA